MYSFRGVAPSMATGNGPTHAPRPPTNGGHGPAPYASPNWTYRSPTPGFHIQQGTHYGAPYPAMQQPQQVGYPVIQPSGRKLPSHAQPGNCELNMTPEDFRTWRTTISMWLGLSRVPDDEGVILIRMYCTPPLQKALDNKIACEEWQRLAPAHATSPCYRKQHQTT